MLFSFVTTYESGREKQRMKMLGLAPLTGFPIPIPIRIPNHTSSKPFPISPIRNEKPPNSHSNRNPRTTGFLVLASKEVSVDESRDSSDNNGEGGGNGAKEEDSEKNNGDGPPPRLNLKWSELLLDRDPDNVVAVALTAVLAWASVRVLWQLFAISFAILVAAIKYSFIAALLIFVLITLL